MDNNARQKLLTGSPRKCIGYVFQDQYPWDVRVEKIVTALADFKFDVHIVSRNRDGLSEYEKLSNRITAHRLPKTNNRFISELINFPAFFSPFWLRKIVHIIKTYSIDIIIVRDLPLAPAACMAGWFTKKPVIMDMAEDYPALIKSTWNFRGPRIVDFFVRNPYLLSKMEKLTVRLLDGILVVSDHSRQRISKLKVDINKIWIVSNTPEDSPCWKTEKALGFDCSIRQKHKFIIVYTGFIEAHRGLDIPIRALQELKKKIPDVLFVIAGTGTYEIELKELTRKLKVEKNTYFTGWLEHEQIYSLIGLADACVIPHYVTDHVDTTLPNKIFDYMILKKPVIVTHALALREIIEGEQCGVVYTDKSVESFSRAVQSLFDKEIRNKMGINGWLAVRNKYNWEKDKARLINAVQHGLNLNK